MDREEMLSHWSSMWEDGNWVPSWPDSLVGLTAEAAAWTSDLPCHSIWAEVAHVIFWRQITLRQIAGGPPSTEQEVNEKEFAVPESKTDDAWTATVSTLKQTQDDITAAIQDPAQNVDRIPYHLIHDAYHLGRVTQLRIMLGTAPKF